MTASTLPSPLPAACAILSPSPHRCSIPTPVFLQDREALREQAAQLGPLRQALEKAEGQAKRSAAALRVVSGLHTEVKLTGLVAKLGVLVQVRIVDGLIGRSPRQQRR